MDAAENSTEQHAVVPRRVVGRPWPKGVSGNPGGRPKEVGHVRELARQYSEEAILTLVDVMRHGKPDRARAAAAEALLDRAWGRPPQEVAVTGEQALVVDIAPHLSEEQLQQARAEILARLERLAEARRAELPGAGPGPGE